MAFDISYIFRAFDEFSEPVKKMGESVEVFMEKMGVLDKRFGHMAHNIVKVGKKVSMNLTAPILGIGALSLHEFSKANEAVSQVQNTLKRTGDTAKLSFSQLQNSAEEIQKTSLFTHTEILGDVTTRLLRFGHIHGQVFLNAQKAIADYSAATKTDLSAASFLIGRALNDPINGINALGRRVGLARKQLEIIQHIAKTSGIPKAQEAILAVFNKKYGGSAEIQAQSGLGPLRNLMNQLEDILEDFGKDIAEVIMPYIPIIKSYVEAFKKLNPETKKHILLLAALAATVGPLIIALGILVTAIGVLISPVGLVVTGILALTAALIWLYKHLPSFISTFKQRFSQNVTHGGFFDAYKPQNTDGLKALLHGDFHRVAEIYKAHVRIDINDKNENVKSVHTAQSGSGMHLNVGRNMAHVPG